MLRRNAVILALTGALLITGTGVAQAWDLVHDRSGHGRVVLRAWTRNYNQVAFIADHVIRTKHTANLKSRLPGLVSELIEPLADQREAQHRTFERYKVTHLDSRIADHAIMEMYRQGVIGVQRIADVHQQWEKPQHDWGEKTAWRMFNAAMFALTGRVAENPRATSALHKIIDGVCERVH